MTVVAVIGLVIYAFVNGFGAWMVLNRKGWIAGLFMIAAAILMISAAGVIFHMPFTRFVVASGLILASVGSFINARVVAGYFRPRNHITRLVTAVVLFIVVHFALS